MKKKTLKKWKGIVGIGFGLAVAAGLGVLYWKIPDNRPWQYVILEAGAPLPQPEDFLIKRQKAETSFVSDISSIDTKVPGDYTVELASGRFQYSSVADQGYRITAGRCEGAHALCRRDLCTDRFSGMGLGRHGSYADLRVWRTRF